MKLFRIADLHFLIEGTIELLRKNFCNDWEVFTKNKPNHSITIFRQNPGKSTAHQVSETYYNIHRQIAEKIPEDNALILHSACFDIDGVGVAFAALSGTGKTTQMLNWQKLLGEKMTIVNGDKPIIRFFDKDFCENKGLEIPEGTEFGVPYAYGTPWCGKEGLGCNMRTPLKHICFIERSETNYVTKIEKHEAIDRIMRQVYIPKDPEALSKTLELVNRLINSCELWIIHCNMEPESAKIAYETIIGK